MEVLIITNFSAGKKQQQGKFFCENKGYKESELKNVEGKVSKTPQYVENVENRRWKRQSTMRPRSCSGAGSMRTGKS
ncbi:hypothetical protein [Paenibacillus chitinolyticus]|uniref:hypothetical protein n=1 Tax=Paenibacillus chitinolyticus TaxID=79263 RepID=UPI00366BD122